MNEKDLDALEGSLSKKQTPEDLRLLASLRESPFWPPLRQILMRMQVAGLDALVEIDANAGRLAKAQGKVLAARELLQFLEEEAPRRYQDLREHENRKREGQPGEARRNRSIRGRRGS